MSQPCLVFNNLTLGYDRHPAIHHLNGTLDAGSLTALVGPNGSGKSTLLKGIAGIIKPMSGNCSIQTGTRIAWLPQKCELDTNFPACVVDFVSLGLWHEIGFFGRLSKNHKEKITLALEATGLSGFEFRPISTLSGGQIQRALFARVILQNANLILLDEPFSALDSDSTSKLMSIVNQWHKEGRTILVVLHDLDRVQRYFPETILLARHLISWGKTDKVFRSKAFLQRNAFQEAWVENAPWCETSSNSCLKNQQESFSFKKNTE